MARLFGCIVIVLMIGALAGCSLQRSADAEKARKKMVGMNKEEILECMGVPGKKAKLDETEVWYYRSTNGMGTSGSATHKYGESSGSADYLGGSAHYRYFCDINIIMKNDKVTKVHYNGPAGGWLDDNEQCAYAIQHCADDD